jgi:xanthine dehydrogenase accessory factor
MDAGEYRVLIRGAGELASATAHHLYTQGFKRILLLDRRYPKAVRRLVCYSEAILRGNQEIQGVRARFARSVDAVEEIHSNNEVAVAVLNLEDTLKRWEPEIFIEAAMLRRNWGLKPGLAPVVIALGPGYVAKKDCHAVVETVRGPQVGAVFDDTGDELENEPPAEIMGFTEERVVKAIRDGIFFTQRNIGEEVERGERIGTVVSVYGVEDFRRGVPVDASYAVTARISGVVRGLLRDGVPVKAGDRISDVDPRGRTDDLDHVSDKSHRVAEGVHEALLGLLKTIPKKTAKPQSKPKAKPKARPKPRPKAKTKPKRRRAS